MWPISDAYRAHSESGIVRKAHAKIIVDGVTYDGYTAIKTFPSVSCAAEFIGSFPAKSCTFEIYGRPDLVGKKVEVFRGLEIDGAIEWVPLGIFTATADGVKTSDTGDSLTFTGYDAATLFDSEYTPLEIAYPTTIGVFAQEIAFRHGVDFDTTPFPCCDVILNEAPNIPAGTSEREIIRQIAELGGANAYITRTGALSIKQPTATTERISKRKYTSLTKEPAFGGINTVVLGKSDYDDDIVYQDAEAVAADGVIEWRLENNIFAEVDRQAFAEFIGQTYIIGLSYVPFSASGCVDDWYLDVGDVVLVQGKNGEYFETVLLTYNTTDRIRATLGAETPGEMLTNYELAGSTKKKLDYALLQVDHINNEITSKVSKDGVISAINQTAEEISIDASKINLTGYITASDLGAEGETVIHGGRIDTDSLYVRYLEGAEGNFKNLTADDGGKLKIGKWEFLQDGLEYEGGVFDIEYSGGLARIAGTAPMIVGPYTNGITNTLSLYGTFIEFGVSASEYYCLLNGNVTSGGITYREICFYPSEDETGNIGLPNQKWDTGHFRNFNVYDTLSAYTVRASSNVNTETLNVGSAARVSGTMVIGSSSADQPSSGLRIVGALYATGQLTCSRAVVSDINTAGTGEDYASDKVVTVGASSGRLYKTVVPFSRLYSVVGTSTAKSKHNIKPLGEDYNIVDLLEPIQFNYNSDGEKGLGLLAEDLAELAPDLCYYDDDGQVEGIKYNSIIALLIREVQQLKERMKNNGAETN